MGEFDITVKIIFLGDFNVNKGTLLRALGALPAGPEVSCLSIRSGMVEMLFVRDEKRIRAKINDTAGQERFRSVTSSYYRGAHGCLLLFDVTQKSTFDSLNDWQEELRAHTIRDDIVVTLAGCNCHAAAEERQVAKRSAQAFADNWNIAYEEVSVKTVSTLLRVLEDMIDKIVLKASRMPVLSNSITPLERRLQGALEKGKDKRRTCAC